MSKKAGITFLNPFLPFDNDQRLEERLAEIFGVYGINRLEITEGHGCCHC